MFLETQKRLTQEGCIVISVGFIGLLDPSVRPWVGKNELSFTIPYSRFLTMMETMKDCFLFDSHAWEKIKARMDD